MEAVLSLGESALQITIKVDWNSSLAIVFLDFYHSWAWSEQDYGTFKFSEFYVSLTFVLHDILFLKLYLETMQENRIKIGIYFRFQASLKLQLCSAPHQHDRRNSEK